MKRLAICQPQTLLGKELREVLGRPDAGVTPGSVLLLSSDPAHVGTLTEVGGAATMVLALETERFAEVDIALWCGPVGVNRPLLEALPTHVRSILLSTDAELSDGEPVVAGVNDEAAQRDGVLLSPHPAVVLLAHLLHPLTPLLPSEAVATVLLPASVYEQEGLEELFEQARRIITMSQRPPTRFFGAQLAFNLLPAGPGVGHGLPAQLARVLGGFRAQIQLIQGGTFHGLAVSLFVRCGKVPTPAAIRRAFHNAPLVGFATDAAHLGPIKSVNSDHVLLGSTRQEGDGVWMWAAVDNLARGGALNAVEIARLLG